MPRPTVYDVAARAGVSIATVSRALSRPDDVAPATRDRVTAAVAELGFVPNASARGLAGSRTRVVGLILPPHDEDEPEGVLGGDGGARVVDDREGDYPVPPVENLYYDEVIRGAERAASAAGHALIIAAGSSTTRGRLLPELAARSDGLIVVSSVSAPSDARIPTVLVAGGEARDGADRVGVANAVGMRTLIDSVLAHPSVSTLAYVEGPADSDDARERRVGLDEAVDAARGAGRELELRTVAGDFTDASGAAAVRELLAERGAPDAIVCANDQSALGVLGALHRRGVDVPGRVLVTGFDGVAASGYTTPRLTTVRQPMADLGYVAVRMLLERLADPSLPSRRRTLPVEVLLRESCPPA